MKTIFKYPLEISDIQEIELPKGAQILDIDVQHGLPVMWALVDPTEEKEKRRFHTTGTGHPIHDPGALKHVGSYQLDGGSFVGHLFEVVAP